MKTMQSLCRSVISTPSVMTIPDRRAEFTSQSGLDFAVDPTLMSSAHPNQSSSLRIRVSLNDQVPDRK